MTVKDKCAEIESVLKAHQGERHLVVMQDYPDPDAISSGFTHRMISEKYGIETDLIYDGEISHQQNIALVKVLGIELTRYTRKLDLQTYDGAVYVDTQGTTCEDIASDLEEAGVPAVLVVDHHEKQNRLSPQCADIRRTGATATIYAEYLQEGLIELDAGDDDHVAAATALLFGIMTDTANFVRAGDEDFRAAAFLSRYRDSELLERIMSQSLSKPTMETISTALKNRRIVESFSISGIGYVRAKDRDAIPQATDFLITEENVHSAIVFGIVTSEDGEEKLVGSMRTTKFTISPDDFIKDSLGRDAEGQFYGGGKVSAGGFEIPIGFLTGEHSEEYGARKWELYDEQIRHKLLAKIGVHPDPGDGV